MRITQLALTAATAASVVGQQQAWAQYPVQPQGQYPPNVVYVQSQPAQFSQTLPVQQSAAAPAQQSATSYTLVQDSQGRLYQTPLTSTQPAQQQGSRQPLFRSVQQGGVTTLQAAGASSRFNAAVNQQGATVRHGGEVRVLPTPDYKHGHLPFHGGVHWPWNAGQHAHTTNGNASVADNSQYRVRVGPNGRYEVTFDLDINNTTNITTRRIQHSGTGDINLGGGNITLTPTHDHHGHGLPTEGEGRRRRGRRQQRQFTQPPAGNTLPGSTSAQRFQGSFPLRSASHR